jgi:membrane-bound lytic murein transglycosylase B
VRRDLGSWEAPEAHVKEAVRSAAGDREDRPKVKRAKPKVKPKTGARAKAKGETETEAKAKERTGDLAREAAPHTGHAGHGGSAAPAPAAGAAPGTFVLPSAAIGGEADVPAFLIPIYKAAAKEHDLPWEVLAAINEMETDFGRNVAVSSAGAVGWMQFMPATWRAYGVDADGDGRKDPNDP